MSEAFQDILREAWFAVAVIAGLWFGCYLYEIGFLARFGVPPLVAEVGFSRQLATILVAGPAAAGAAALLLWPVRVLAIAGATQMEAGYPALWGVLALGVCLAGAEPAGLFLADGYDLDLNPIKLVLAGALIAATALLFTRFRTSARQGDFGGIAQYSLLVLLFTLVALGLGWMGAGHKMENRRSFFYLAERPDYVLIRLYDERAVFARFDRATGRFEPDYLISRDEDSTRTQVTRRPAGR